MAEAARARQDSPYRSAFASGLAALRRIGIALPRAALQGLLGKGSVFQQFALLSLIILIVGAYVIGRYVASEIEGRVMQRTSALTALYVDSFVTPHMQELRTGHNVSETHFQHLDELLGATRLGQEIVAFKLWHNDGDVVYSNQQSLIGRAFPIEGGLKEALSGRVHTEMSGLTMAENEYERGQWRALLETYAPIRDYETGQVIGATEFYQDPSEMQAEIDRSQRKGWLIVGGATIFMYLLLVGIVRRASLTITSQNSSLIKLAGHNAELAERVRRAAAQKSETDEQLLKRVAQDLHDGPVQDVALALFRLDNLVSESKPRREKDTDVMRTALSGALREIREICAGLRLPEMEYMTLGEVIRRAAEEHQAKTGNTVKTTVCSGLPPVDSPTKIAVYRVIQEALNNAHRHGQASTEQVRISLAGRWLELEIRDDGSGLDSSPADSESERGRFGIRGMRERVEMLGGDLQVSRLAEGGTLVSARLPLTKG